jgi:hypothetical protein
VAFLSRLGIDHFAVDASGFDVNVKPVRTRSDSSERLRGAHQAAAYDKWFREQVQESLDDARPNVSHDVVMSDSAARRARLQKKIRGGKS